VIPGGVPVGPTRRSGGTLQTVTTLTSHRLGHPPTTPDSVGARSWRNAGRLFVTVLAAERPAE